MVEWKEGLKQQELEHILRDFSLILEIYAYHFGSSALSLPRSMAATFTIRWHFGRRIKTLERIYRTVLAMCNLNVFLSQEGRVADSEGRDQQKKLARFRETINEFDELLDRLHDLSKLIPSRALAYLSSAIIAAFAFLVPLAANWIGVFPSTATEPGETWLVASAGIPLAIGIVAIAAWDANLWSYLKATTHKVGKERSLMQLELCLYRDAFSVIGTKPKRLGIRRILIADVGLLVLVGFLLLGAVALLLFLVIFPLRSPVLSLLSLVLVPLVAIIPPIVGAYLWELTRSLRALEEEPETIQRPDG